MKRCAPHVDRALVDTLLVLMGQEFPLLVDTFLDDGEERLLLLRRTCEAGRGVALRRAAHSFKGSCSNMGAPALAELCDRLETVALQGDLAEAPLLIECIRREFALVRELFLDERRRCLAPGN